VSAARLLSALAGAAARRPRLTIALACALGVGGAVLALGLRPSATTDTFVGRSSAAYQATQRFYQRFGEEPVEVLVAGNLQQLVLSSDIERLAGLEGCLSGNLPAAAIAQEGGASGPCGQLASAHAVRVVLGPGTFINEAALQIDQQLSSRSAQAEAQARQAEQVVYRTALARNLSVAEAHTLAAQASRTTLASFEAELATLALQYGLSSTPSISDPSFVSKLVFDPSKPAGTPKQRFAYLFPGPNAALVSVRLRPGLSEQARTHAIALIRRAVAMPQWQLRHGSPTW